MSSARDRCSSLCSCLLGLLLMGPFALLAAGCTTPPVPRPAVEPASDPAKQVPAPVASEVPGGTQAVELAGPAQAPQAAQLAQVAPAEAATGAGQYRQAYRQATDDAGRSQALDGLQQALVGRGSAETWARALLPAIQTADSVDMVLAGRILQERADPAGAIRAYLEAHLRLPGDPSVRAALDWLLSGDRLDEIQRRAMAAYGTGGSDRVGALTDLHRLAFYQGVLDAGLLRAEGDPAQATDVDLGIALTHFRAQGYLYRATRMALALAERDALAPEVLAYFQEQGPRMAQLVPVLIAERHEDLVTYAEAYARGLMPALQDEEALAVTFLWVLAGAEGKQDLAQKLARRLLDRRADRQHWATAASEAAAVQGMVLDRAGKQDEALLAWRQAVELDPGSDGAWHATPALVARGVAAEDLPELARLGLQARQGAGSPGQAATAVSAALAYQQGGGHAAAIWGVLAEAAGQGAMAPADVADRILVRLSSLSPGGAAALQAAVLDELPHSRRTIEGLLLALDRARLEGRQSAVAARLFTALSRRSETGNTGMSLACPLRLPPGRTGAQLEDAPPGPERPGPRRGNRSGE